MKCLRPGSPSTGTGSVAPRLEARFQGPPAVDVMRSHADRIGVIISDMVMPRMTGLQLAADLEESGADVPIVFVSGYSWSALTDQGIESGAVRVLRKPFSPTRLMEAVSDLISGDRVPR